MRNSLSISLPLAILLLTTSCSYFEKKAEESPKKTEVEEKKEKEKSSEPAKLKKDFSPSIEVKTLWKKKFGQGLDEHYLKLRPSVRDETLFISDREGQLIAVDALTGKVKWKIKEKNVEYTSSAGLGDGMVFVGTGDGRVIARDIETGKLKWIIRTSSEILAAPTSSEGITVVRSADGSVIGLESRTGTELWNYRRAAPRLTLRGNSRPHIDGGVLFSALDSGRLIALDLRLGKSIWNKAITVPSGVTDLERMVDLDGDPIVTEDFIYVSSYQGGVTALSKVDGQIIWARQISSYNGLARGNGRIYVVDEDSVIWALDEEDGISIWKQGELSRRFLTDPVFFENYIIVGDLEGYVHWIAADSGQVVFRTRLDKKSIMAPAVVANDIIIIRSATGKTIAMRRNNS